MTTFTNIRLAQRLDELSPVHLREEAYHLVIDTRIENGCAAPAREILVRRLGNWRIDYVQVPVDFEANDHTAKAKLEAMLNECNGTAVMITNQVFAAQGYLLMDSKAQSAVEGSDRISGLESPRPTDLTQLYAQVTHASVSG